MQVSGCVTSLQPIALTWKTPNIIPMTFYFDETYAYSASFINRSRVPDHHISTETETNK
jgi:hypothetical protein